MRHPKNAFLNYFLKNLIAVDLEPEFEAEHFRSPPAHNHSMEEDFEIIVHRADAFVDLEVERDMRLFLIDA